MFNNNSYRPAFEAAGQASSPQNARHNSGILFNTTSSETEDFNSFASTQQTRTSRRSSSSKQPKRSGELDLKKLLVIAASVAAVVLLGIVIALVATSSGGDLSVKNNSFASYEIDGKYFVAMNGKTVGAGFDNEIELITAADNSFAYIIEDTPDGYSIYVLEKNELITVAVSSASAASGVVDSIEEIVALADYVPGVIYKHSNGAFYFYSDENEDRITKNPTADNFTIAPDASAISYTLRDDKDLNNTKLYIYIDGISESYATNMTPVGVANGGKYVYAYGTVQDDSGAIAKKLYVILPGENDKVAIVTGFFSLNYMNIKGDEIIYSTGSLETGVQSYIYNVKKDESFKIGAGVCVPLVSDPSVALLSSLGEIVVENTLPAFNAEGKITTATYYVDKKYDSSLISKYNGTLNSDGDKFYYINDDKTLSFIDLNDKNRNIQKIAEGAVEFVVTEKDNVYYLDDDSRLMFYKESTGKKRKVADTVENMVLNSYSNILYYEIEDDTKAYETEEGSAPEIAKFGRSEIISAPVFASEGQKRTFAYVWNQDTDTFNLYYTSSGKTYTLVAADCNVADESLLDQFFESVGSITDGSNNTESNGNEAATTTAATTTKE